MGEDPTRRAWASLFRVFMDDRVHARLHDVSREIGVPNPGFLKALFWLEPDRPPTMRAMAEHMACDASYVTSIVDELEGRGLVERHASPTDRRVKLVQLTPLGEKTRESAREAMAEPLVGAKRLNAAESRTFVELMGKLLGD